MHLNIGSGEDIYMRLEDHIPTSNLSKQKSRKVSTKGLLKTVQNNTEKLLKSQEVCKNSQMSTH